jgi:gelsolin
MNTFVLRDQDTFYVWIGKFSPQSERDFALQNQLLHGANSRVIEVQQGQEPARFWELLGGKCNYPFQNASSYIQARLFHCTIGTGTFDIYEIVDFCQDDLVTHDTFILDCLTHVFVWFGKRSNDKEQRWTMEATLEYVQSSPSNRGGPPAILRVHETLEPYIFTCHFQSWMVKGKTEQPAGLDGELVEVSALLEQFTRKYTLEELTSGKFSKALDTANLEVCFFVNNNQLSY